MFLTPEQLAELTGFTRSDAQKRQLNFMGIMHRQRADGSLVVLTSHVEEMFGAKEIKRINKKLTEPDWEATI